MAIRDCRFGLKSANRAETNAKTRATDTHINCSVITEKQINSRVNKELNSGLMNR